jgi:hypothetical protein
MEGAHAPKRRMVGGALGRLEVYDENDDGRPHKGADRDDYWLAASIACANAEEARQVAQTMSERLVATEGHVVAESVGPNVAGLLYRRTSPMLSAVLETLVHMHSKAPGLRYLLHLRSPESGATAALLLCEGKQWDALAAASMPWRQCLRAAFGDAWRDALLGVPVPTEKDSVAGARVLHA